MSSPMPMLHLYRNILKAAKYFPSRKRAGIITEIKQEFRTNKSLAEPAKLAQARQVAERGLSDLQAYLPSNADGDAFNLTLKGATT